MSYFKVTVTPTPVTIRTTVTVTTTLLLTSNRKRAVPELGRVHNMRNIYGPVHPLQVLPGNTLHKRQIIVSPTAIPAYASPCSSLAAYSSACSCLNVPRTTITAAASITTTILTVTETVTPPLPTRVVSTSSDSSSSITSSTASSSTIASSTSIPPTTAFNSTTARPTLSHNSTGVYSNTSTPTHTPTRILDTTCGETAAPFALRVSQPGGLFNGWFAHLSGDGVLFTSVQSSATSFSVEGSGHLCAVGYEGEFGYPIIALVTNLTTSGAVWLLDGRRAEAFSEDYVPVECTTEGGGLNCAAGETKNWVGCGMQLDLSSEQGNAVVDGLNCTALSLEVV